ncbi:MAG: hypothetical protein V1792_27805 [Pseudomonadota bacterium]
MPGSGRIRNSFRYKEWIFVPLNREPGSYKFDCGNSKVNEFFLGEFLKYEQLLLCKTYELTNEEIIAENLPPLAFISYCNHSIRLSKVIRKLVKIPEAKGIKECPATKVVWVSVSGDSQHDGVGTDLMNITKLLFLSDENRTGCRLITVDAVNDLEHDQGPIRFYKRNGFVFENPNNNPDDNRGQRVYPMIFDLDGPWDFGPDPLLTLYP